MTTDKIQAHMRKSYRERMAERDARRELLKSWADRRNEAASMTPTHPSLTDALAHGDPRLAVDKINTIYDDKMRGICKKAHPSPRLLEIGQEAWQELLSIILETLLKRKPTRFRPPFAPSFHEILQDEFRKKFRSLRDKARPHWLTYCRDIDEHPIAESKPLCDNPLADAAHELLTGENPRPEAVRLYHLRDTDPKIARELAECARRAYGMPRDLDLSLKWANMALEDGNEDAQKTLNFLKNTKK